MFIYPCLLQCTRTCMPAHAQPHTSTQALPSWSDLAPGPTFSMRSMQGCRSRPKSMKTQSMPSRLYSSCSSTNMCWLKNCCSFSLVKLIHSCSKLLNCRGQRPAQPPYRRGQGGPQRTGMCRTSPCFQADPQGPCTHPHGPPPQREQSLGA